MPQAFARHHRIRLTTLAAATLVAAAGLAVMVAERGQAKVASSSSIKLVKTYDNYYLPNSLTIKVGDRVKFRSWSPFGGPNYTGGPGFTDLHDAVLIKPYPKGVTAKGFRSGPPPGTTNLNWTVRFTKPGAYIFNCTNHSGEMRATIRVRR